MKVGDKVTTDEVYGVKNPVGVVVDIVGSYPYGRIVVQWENVSQIYDCLWHYTYEQAKKIKKIE